MDNKTHHEQANGEEQKTDYCHFGLDAVNDFYDNHAGRQGISVLAFNVSEKLERIRDRYAALHPKLLILGSADIVEYNEDGYKVFEVYAYYKGEKFTSQADCGTILRFVEKSQTDVNSLIPLPGLKAIDAKFNQMSQAAYCDHWVSNVVSRTGFIDTLEDVLGFVPKVDFNAGMSHQILTRYK